MIDNDMLAHLYFVFFCAKIERYACLSSVKLSNRINKQNMFDNKQRNNFPLHCAKNNSSLLK